MIRAAVRHLIEYLTSGPTGPKVLFNIKLGKVIPTLVCEMGAVTQTAYIAIGQPFATLACALGDVEPIE